MTRKAHAMRNHKNLRLVIPGANSNGSVVLQHPAKPDNTQPEEKPEIYRKKSYAPEM